MKANRTCIVLIMLLCANVLFAQRNGVIGQPTDRISDWRKLMLLVNQNTSPVSRTYVTPLNRLRKVFKLSPTRKIGLRKKGVKSLRRLYFALFGHFECEKRLFSCPFRRFRKRFMD